MVTKQQVLDEIRRTAAGNGGTPLGTHRFERETGIAPHDWEKFWPRFGDAQREAGFDPNQMTAAHADDYLVQAAMAVTRQLGKFPTGREIAVARLSDPKLPTPKAFRRIGGKVELIRRVTEFCADKPEYQDVLALCKAAVETGPAEPTDVGDESRRGEVYLYKSGRYYKIGKTNNTVRRGNEIRLQLPETPVLIHSITTDDPSGVELYWHRRFAAKRVNGEWFDLGPAEIRAFKRWRRIF